MSKLTIAKVAEDFAEQRRDRYSYRPENGQLRRRRWFIWDGTQWRPDDARAVVKDARDFARRSGLRMTASTTEEVMRRARVSLSE